MREQRKDSNRELTQKIKNKILKQLKIKTDSTTKVNFKKIKNNEWFLIARSRTNSRFYSYVITIKQNKWYMYKFYIYKEDIEEEIKQELFNQTVTEVIKYLNELCETKWQNCPKEILKDD